MQGDHRTDSKIAATQKFSPVVTTAQEAIGIYDQLLKEFPKFDKRDKVLYRLAVSQKSIDESAAFVKTAEQLIKEFRCQRNGSSCVYFSGNTIST